MKFSLSYDPGTTMRRTLYVDNADPRKVAVETTQNKTKYYEANKAIRQSGYDLKLPDWGVPVGDIPYEDYMELCKEYPELKAKGPGTQEAKQKAYQKIFTTHPKRHLWMWRDRF